ncbi:MAG: ABC transporter permease [Acidobacteriota bacterium]
MFSGFLQDLRYGFRQLRKEPLFAAVAILLLAIGIGANTAIFSVIDSALLRPLPYPEPERLFYVRVKNFDGGAAVLPNMFEYLALEKGISSAEAVGTILGQPFNLKWNGRSMLVSGAYVSPGYFRALGVKLLAGREFFPEEYVSGKNQAVYFDEAFWRSRLGGDPGILGKTVEMEKEVHVVAGILPGLPGQRSTSARGPEAVVPLPITQDMIDTFDRRSMVVAVRLKKGATKEQAEEEIRALYRRLAEQEPRSSRNKEGYLASADEFLRGSAHQPLIVLALAAGLALLLACANLAGLLLARASSRLRELAIRSALGASQVRIFRQMLTESVMLSLLGGAAGLGVAGWAIDFLRNWNRLRLPGIGDARINLDTLLFALAVSVAAGLVFGTAPAWSVLRLNLATALNEESRGASAGRGRSLLRSLLIGAEVAICATLLVGSGLLWRTYYRLTQTDMGFRPDNVLLLRTMLPQAAYPDDAARSRFYRTVLGRMKEMPGVVEASVTAYPPLAHVNWACMFRIPGHETAGEFQQAYYNTVSPRYFAAIGARLTAGRDFQDSDTRESPRVLVISETLRRQFFPNEDPIGREIEFVLMGEKRAGTVVGVVQDIAFDQPDNTRRAMIYESFTQQPWAFPFFALKSAVPPMELAPAIARMMSEVAPDVSADQVNELRVQIERATGQHSAALFLFGVFAGLAVLLSGVGLYGVLALAVAQQRREIGIRMALGATPGMIRTMTLRSGLVLAGVGILAGLLSAPLTGQTLRRMIYGVDAFDLAVYAGVAALLATVSLCAALVPALRAAGLDPAAALRE